MKTYTEEEVKLIFKDFVTMLVHSYESNAEYLVKIGMPSRASVYKTIAQSLREDYEVTN